MPFDRRSVWWPLLLRRAPWVVRRAGEPLWRKLPRSRGLLCRGGGFDTDNKAAVHLMDGRALPPGHCDLIAIRLDFAGFEHATLRPDCTTVCSGRDP